jgi:hypothetical protein
MNFSYLLRALCFVSVLIAVGCGSAQENLKDKVDMMALGAEKTKAGNLVERYDLNGDRKADFWKVYKLAEKDGKEVKRLVRKDMDLNFDGKVDVRQDIDVNGQVVREFMDLDFDGHVDATAFYKDNVIIRREIDVTFDGKSDVIKYYAKGKLVRKVRDTNRDGRMDLWEYYNGGVLIRVGRDRDGNGKPESFEDAPRQPVEEKKSPKSKSEEKKKAPPKKPAPKKKKGPVKPKGNVA